MHSELGLVVKMLGLQCGKNSGRWLWTPLRRNSMWGILVSVLVFTNHNSETLFSNWVFFLSVVCTWVRFHWIRRIGRPARKEVAPIVVSNHVSFIDPIFYFYELFPSIVSSKSHDSLFLAGTIIRAMQVLKLSRTLNSYSRCFLIEILLLKSTWNV